MGNWSSPNTLCQSFGRIGVWGEISGFIDPKSIVERGLFLFTEIVNFRGPKAVKLCN